MLLTPFRQLLASFPQLQRRIEVQATLFKEPPHFDEFVTAGFVATLTNRSNRRRPVVAAVVPSGHRSVPRLAPPRRRRQPAPATGCPAVRRRPTATPPEVRRRERSAPRH